MKFILVSIAVILVILGIYTYSNQSTEKSSPTPSVSEKKKEVKKTEKVSVVVQEVKEKKSSVKNITVKSPKVISQEMGNEEEIGEGLTLESIENADVSDEEKEVMRMDMAYEHNLNSEPSEPLSYEEVREMIEQDVKNGI